MARRERQAARVTFAPEARGSLATFAEVLDERPSFSVIALNAPIGYVEEIQQAGGPVIAWLGPSWAAGSTIHNAPTRATCEEACRRHGRPPRCDQHIVLFRRYREVAAEMAPYRQRTVYEVHPELSFFQINGDEPLRWSKKFEAGREERRALLEKRIPGSIESSKRELDDVPLSHLLDAAAMLWTARRIFARAGTRFPTDPEWDDQGLRMEFVR